MFSLKSIDIASLALYSFLMYLILGLIIFLPLGFFFSIVSNFLPDTGEFDSMILPFFGGIFLILIPLLYAVFGTIMNVIIVIIYNLLSKKFGGIKIELSRDNQIDQAVGQH